MNASRVCIRGAFKDVGGERRFKKRLKSLARGTRIQKLSEENFWRVRFQEILRFINH